MVITKTFGLGFENIRVNVQNLLFYFIECSLVILYYTECIYIYKNAVFTFIALISGGLNIVVPIILLMSILRGTWNITHLLCIM